MHYFQPHSLREALEIRSRQTVTVLAGGTDIYPVRAFRAAWGDTRESDILDISRIEECRGIAEQEDCFRIGALTTWSDLAGARLPRYFEGLKQAAREIGGLQIQNRGTLAGNLCNASPAADGVPALLTLEAAVELAGRAGKRRLPLAEFITGYRATACAADELVTAIRIPKRGDSAHSRFLKLGARRYLVISIVMVAGLMAVSSDGTVAELRVAIGSCSPVARRLSGLEARLTGQPADLSLAERVRPEDFEPLRPIDDCRASGAYRLEAAQVLTKRLLKELCWLCSQDERRA